MTSKSPFGPTLVAWAAILAVGALAIGLTSNSYIQLILTLVSVWAMLGLSWNILGGYAGLVSFGHAAFFGLGAFTVVILGRDYDISPWLSLPLAAVIGAGAGCLLGGITFRLTGPYFSLAMLAYPLALLPIFEWAGWTEMAMPMKRENAALYMQFSDGRVMALICLAFLGLCLAISLWIERSRFGLCLTAIKQNELAARAAGVATLRWKLYAITISGAMAAVAGALYSVVLLVVSPHSVFGMLISAQALIIPMFGGIGSAWGTIIGAATLVPLSEALHALIGDKLSGIQGVVYGIAIILVVLLRPQGLYWAIRDALAGVFARSGEQDLPAVPDIPPPPPVPIGTGTGSAAAGPLLSVKDVSVQFGGLKAISDVALSVQQGEILGIIGPNGAGKTTLFNVLSGLVTPKSGSITFAGEDLSGKTPEAVCAAGIARTFQTVRSFPRLSLFDNVLIGAYVRHRDDDEAAAAAAAALRRVGLQDRMAAPASTLTNRELRLMELARALAGQPRLILMDESFAGLASEDIETMLPLLRSLRDEGLTIVIIEHTMQAMVRLSDRLVVLDHGVVIASGPPKEVVRQQDVIVAYLGRKWAQNAEN
ncbi:branched-chain amino acid ABC transporter ATP-binding protein/permease [Bosea sp. (in: a-proteobacteria)]|uniref:branched-chain amino acid ABC transporter ATP-binding protein/permease n=1 Tax=Bosea sp. (in: a-proteobacteria) TaxID=1871050 RepID=UPI00261F234D|nr:branched-chain amino acid ABC transporter ATP-binding protein/permease [Bosea sp. (in: a-proteobacteria)]MCO5091014.1 branched-chain amino acid ABC transporter ATP-binding protein/permease [Bosea sp. (in: a-proteobacteria)]